MDKIINGKTYNTETAKMVVGWCSEIPRNDPSFFEEFLYRKRTGEFFLYGTGGASTKYAHQVGNNGWTGGEKIIPLSYAAAQEWTEQNASVEEYEEIFGEIHEDDDEKKSVTLNLRVSSIAALKRVSSDRGISASALIDELIESL